jgi:hypothetical protein
MAGGYRCSAMSEVEEGVLTSVRGTGGPWYFSYFDEHGGRSVAIQAEVSLVFGQCWRRRCQWVLLPSLGSLRCVVISSRSHFVW